MRKILVIKHGALGDVILALGPLAAIRAHHPNADITLLTTAPFADFLAASPYIDRVWCDVRPAWWQIAALAGLRRRLRAVRWDMVYDLQTSGRSSRYFRLAGRPPWSGIAAGCSHPHRDPARDHIHTLDRQAGQLADAGIARTPPPDLSWVPARPLSAGLAADGRLALLVPGGSAHRPEKRWPVAGYTALAAALAERGYCPVVIGGGAERDLGAVIARGCPRAFDLSGRTDLFDLTTLARHAALCVGNDTGPMHLFAAAGLRAVVLFSAASDPDLCAPRGPGVTVLRCPDLRDLPVDEVLAAACLGAA